jgi:hypothetical protein
MKGIKEVVNEREEGESIVSPKRRGERVRASIGYERKGRKTGFMFRWKRKCQLDRKYLYRSKSSSRMRECPIKKRSKKNEVARCEAKTKCLRK